MKKSVLCGGILALCLPLIILSGCEKTNLQIVNETTNKNIKKIESTLNSIYVPLSSDLRIDCLTDSNTITEVNYIKCEPNTQSFWDYISNRQSIFSLNPVQKLSFPIVKYRVKLNSQPSQENNVPQALSNYFTKVTNLHSQMESSTKILQNHEQAIDCVNIKKQIMSSRLKKLNDNNINISNETCSEIKRLYAEIDKCCNTLCSSDKSLKNSVSSVKNLKQNISSNLDSLTENYTKISTSLDDRTECLNCICEKLDSTINAMSTTKTDNPAPEIVNSTPHYMETEILLKPIITRDEYMKKFEESNNIKQTKIIYASSKSATTPTKPTQPNNRNIHVEIKERRPQFI